MSWGHFRSSQTPVPSSPPLPRLSQGARWACQPVSRGQGSGPAKPGDGRELLLGDPPRQQGQGKCQQGRPWAASRLRAGARSPAPSPALGGAWGWPRSPVPRIPVSPSERRAQALGNWLEVPPDADPWSSFASFERSRPTLVCRGGSQPFTMARACLEALLPGSQVAPMSRAPQSCVHSGYPPAPSMGTSPA